MYYRVTVDTIIPWYGRYYTGYGRYAAFKYLDRETENSKVRSHHVYAAALNELAANPHPSPKHPNDGRQRELWLP